MNLDLSYIYIKIRQKKICVSMETCDCDVTIPTQGPLATGPSCGRPALTGYARAVPLAVVHISPLGSRHEWVPSVILGCYYFSQSDDHVRK